MTDERLRQAERDSQSGDAEAVERLRQECKRAGHCACWNSLPTARRTIHSVTVDPAGCHAQIRVEMTVYSEDPQALWAAITEIERRLET